MDVKAIHNQEELDKALARIDQLMGSNAGQGPMPGSEEFDELEVLSILVEAYENCAFLQGEA